MSHTWTDMHEERCRPDRLCRDCQATALVDSATKVVKHAYRCLAWLRVLASDEGRTLRDVDALTHAGVTAGELRCTCYVSRDAR